MNWYGWTIKSRGEIYSGAGIFVGQCTEYVNDSVSLMSNHITGQGVIWEGRIDVDSTKWATFMGSSLHELIETMLHYCEYEAGEDLSETEELLNSFEKLFNNIED